MKLQHFYTFLELQKGAYKVCKERVSLMATSYFGLYNTTWKYGDSKLTGSEIMVDKCLSKWYSFPTSYTLETILGVFTATDLSSSSPWSFSDKYHHWKIKLTYPKKLHKSEIGFLLSAHARYLSLNTYSDTICTEKDDVWVLTHWLQMSYFQLCSFLRQGSRILQQWHGSIFWRCLCILWNEGIHSAGTTKIGCNATKNDLPIETLILFLAKKSCWDCGITH